MENIDNIVDLVWDLLSEYDRSVLENIKYIDLAGKYLEINDEVMKGYPYEPEVDISAIEKKMLKEYLLNAK